MSMRLPGPTLRGIALLAIAFVTSGCIVLDLSKVRDSEKAEAQQARIAGTVVSNLRDDSWVVVYVATMPCDDDWAELRALTQSGGFPENPADWSDELVALEQRLTPKLQLADHFVMQRPRFWYTELAPGCYAVGAFADIDRDFKYDDEPVAKATAHPDRLFELRSGDRREEIELVIEADARLTSAFDPVALQIRDQEIRSHNEQPLVSVQQVAVAGEVVDLDDSRFGKENGELGYFEMYRSLWTVGPGVYFLGPYDPKRIPVLFVHGALGYPQEFAALIDGLDRTRYQPWFFFYPSGYRLGPVAEFLSTTMMRLQLRHDFDELAIVAHSMGGLVSRDFVLRHHENVVDDPLKLFVSISTPWGGMPSSSAGVERSPWVIPSWRDLQPDGEFMAQLFFEDPEEKTVRKRLPEQVAFHLLFGVADETVPLDSAIRWEALRDASDRWPLPYGHVDILRSPEASQLLGEILEREFD
jgi:pimeloyl-ACP methyl ester carboxylesterase